MARQTNNLDKIDAYFENKSESEKWLMIFVVAGAVAFLAYSFIYPSAKSSYDASLVRRKTIMDDIAKSKNYLLGISNNGDRNYKIRQLNQKITSKKKIQKQYEKKIATIKFSLNKLSGLLFNKSTWSKFLNSITDRAASNNIQIDRLSNKYIDGNSSFGHVLEIGIRCTGGYHNILNFMNDIEQNILVTDIFASNTYADVNMTRIVSDINISVWGINH